MTNPTHYLLGGCGGVNDDSHCGKHWHSHRRFSLSSTACALWHLPVFLFGLFGDGYRVVFDVVIALS